MPALPTSAEPTCTSAAGCSYNGHCTTVGACVCSPGWSGAQCTSLRWAADGARRAFNDSLWTWGGSPVRGPDGLIHMFASELTNGCGILHYCSNSQVIHLTATDPLGPFTRRAVALAPRPPPAWDSGAVHGPTIHALPGGGGWALYYMGTKLDWNGTHHPNCSTGVDPQQGDRATRRIGVATSASLHGPWTRRDEPIFAPGDRAAGVWDWLDVSNPTPILFRNGSALLLYKGRGRVQARAHRSSAEEDLHCKPVPRLRTPRARSPVPHRCTPPLGHDALLRGLACPQAMGVAFGPRFDGPFERLRPAAPIAMPGAEDTWGWRDERTGVLHTLSHRGNGAAAAGAHAYSLDGVTWHQAEQPAYTGRVLWADGTSRTLARRERPQALLGGGGSGAAPEVVCTSAQDQVDCEDGGPEADRCRTYTICARVDLSG